MALKASFADPTPKPTKEAHDHVDLLIDAEEAFYAWLEEHANDGDIMGDLAAHYIASHANLDHIQTLAAHHLTREFNKSNPEHSH